LKSSVIIGGSVFVIFSWIVASQLCI